MTIFYIETDIEPVAFKSSAPEKKRNCKKGFACGATCLPMYTKSGKKTSCGNKLESETSKVAAKALKEGVKKKAESPKEKPKKETKTNKAKPNPEPKETPKPAEESTNQPSASSSVTIPSQKEAKANFDKIGEGEYGAVYQKDGVAYKYGRIAKEETALTEKAGELGVGPKLLGKSDDGYAMEYLGNHSTLLDHYINDIGENPVKVKQNIVSAVARLHREGIGHGDLHVENVLVDRKNDVKLIDYGFAKSGSAAHDLLSQDIRSLGSILNAKTIKDRPKFMKAQKTVLDKLSKSKPGSPEASQAISDFYSAIEKLNYKDA